MACRLTSGESDLLELTQKRVLKIIYPDPRYNDVLRSTHLEICVNLAVNLTHDTRNQSTYHCFKNDLKVKVLVQFQSLNLD